jgi:hypothetical protein
LASTDRPLRINFSVGDYFSGRQVTTSEDADRARRGCQTEVMDRVLHPVEPLAMRLSVAGQF